jgi:hypothetical protein
MLVSYLALVVLLRARSVAVLWSLGWRYCFFLGLRSGMSVVQHAASRCLS